MANRGFGGLTLSLREAYIPRPDEKGRVAAKNCTILHFGRKSALPGMAPCVARASPPEFIGSPGKAAWRPVWRRAEREDSMVRISCLTIVSAGLVALGAPTAVSQPKQPQLGKVHFETSCTLKAQKAFDRGMLYQHSFWYRASRRTFEEALKTDPKCGIAYWGIALSALENPHVPPAAKNLADGSAAIEAGKSLGAKTQRERDYIDALSRFYADHEKVDHRTRVQAYLKAMEDLVQRYPKDDEAKIAYAIALNVAASPVDKTYANQLKGAALLEPIFKRQPNHPGVAHYLIHLHDYPPMAEKGLEAARRYSKIAAAAPHAQHMPSHIFTRVGYWEELDQVELDLGADRKGEQRRSRSASRDGLPRLRPPAARSGQEGGCGN